MQKYARVLIENAPKDTTRLFVQYYTAKYTPKPAPGELTPNYAPYTTPPPRTAFSSFIDHPDEFITFLEACLEEKDLRTTDKTDLYTTLFEMYLYKAKENKSTHEREKWEAQAKKLIEGEHVPMESSNVLLLSHMSDFTDGTVLVKEQAGLLFDMLHQLSKRTGIGLPPLFR